VNVTGSAIVANTVASGVGPGGLCLTSSTDLDVVVDVTGALTPDGPLSYVALHPTRVLDTRLDTSPYTHRVAGGQVLSLNLQGLPGMPVNTGAVMVNVTAVDGSADGFVTVFPCGAEADTSSLNFPAGRAVGALALSTLGGGALCVRSSTRAHLIVDLLGAWAPQPVAPVMDAGAPVMDAATPRDVVTPVDRSLPNDLPLVTDVGAPRDAVADRGTVTDLGAVADRPSAPDARLPDGALADAGGADAGDAVVEDAPPGCACRATAAAPAPAGWLLAFALLRRRRRTRR
jgi:MYXO-CTERM domain-containing protein